ncbi:type II secretory ATPase GspE/PulE/Tfp pilus assembly ATPase PilB-like protein [Clostridium pascui]|uniref:GspE/PulE family protein n=1 Tax=Clostridium pascui TaxID=46609 RepID=UPI0019592108|nr:ATPase, T2SS/T4P/T4SS family [Clostridium pascui]MBM7869343.1 type II secretory ATPase GspE/PulE/Tfp pilus assembly ATPase PilB-like protein [Clostridium pascui]
MDNKGKVVDDLELRYIDVDALKISSEALKLIPMDISRRYSILPFKIAQDKLQLISAEDLNAYAIEELKFISKKKIEAFKGDREKILNLIYKNYEEKEAQEAVYKLNEAEESKNQLIKKESLNSPIIKILNYIITEAILKKSSDIHLEPNDHNVAIRFRIDGVLYRVQEIPKNIFNQVTIRIKILSNLDITEKRIPQDGKFEYKANSKTYDIRVSSMPTIYGEKLALRILYKDSENISLSKLGFDNKGIQLIRSFLNIPYGMVLVTGPTGSGKTTTLYSMINEIDKQHKNIITIEDPVEYNVKDINQINVNNKTGLTFTTGLKSILRQYADYFI